MESPPARSPGVPREDRALGLGAYVTTTPAVAGRVRTRAEDFEVVELGGKTHAQPSGTYTRLVVRARNWETNRLVTVLARAARVPRHAITISGAKDKHAVTTQQVVIRAPLERLQALSLPDIEVLKLEPVAGPTALGMHAGNAFTVRVRGIGDRRSIESALGELAGLGWVPNWFGPQRFGAERATTHNVGFAILRGDLLGAVKAYITPPHPRDTPDVTNARRLAGEGLWTEALPGLPQVLDHERALVQHMANEPADPEGALAQLPSGLRPLFVHAAQSWMFNRALSERLDARLPIDSVVEGDLLAALDEAGSPEPGVLVPVTTANLGACRRACERAWGAPTGSLPGYEAPLAGGVPGGIERRVLAEAGLELADFLLPHLPAGASAGERRPLVAFVRELDWAWEEDDLGEHLRLSFALPRGAYATNLLRELLKGPPAMYG